MTREGAPLPEPASLPPSRTERTRLLRRELERLEPGLRVIAEDVLAQSSRIDVIGADGRRRVVAAIVAEGDAVDRALTLALAHRSWLIDHVPDWPKLAPDLPIDATAGVRTLLVAPEFDPELVAAVAALPTGWIELVRLVEIARGGQVHGELVRHPVLRRNGADPDRPAGSQRRAGAAARFRTGLTARDLGLSDEEIAQFD